MPLELSAGALAAALGLFNLGVELGQLVIVASALLALAALARGIDAPRRVHDLGSAALAVLGGLWFLQRVL